MSVLNDGNNLPGVLIDYEREIAQEYDPSQWGTTDAVLIIGTAFTGTPGIAVQLYNGEMAEYMFGKSYDEKTNRTATLSAAVADAYDRGCRTIYGMRIGGKEIYKDFKFCDNHNNYRLRVRGMYPTNVVKDCSILLNLSPGIESISFYKPATKATITERKSGLVTSADAVICHKLDFADYGYSRDTKLVEIINSFNTHSFNNVLEMAIVDEDGNDVTNTAEAQGIRVGACFPGLYLVGRDASVVAPYTTIQTMICTEDGVDKPYAGYSGNIYRQLKFNSDVSADYPIYATVYNDMKDILYSVSITSATSWDFLEVNGMLDRAFSKDEIDYEEVNMSPFDIYKALGEGYATTAMAVSRGVNADGVERKPRVIETPVDNVNHIVGIHDGIYSIAQNAAVKYRVLTCVNADDKIANKIPTADDFKIAIANDIPLFGVLDDGSDALVAGTPIIDPDDLSNPKQYSFEFHKIREDEVITDNPEEIYTTKIADVVDSLTVENDEDTLAETILKKVGDKGFIKKNTKVMVFDKDGKGHLMRYINNKKIDELGNAGLEDELFAVRVDEIDAFTDAISSKIVVYIGVKNEDTKSVIFEPLTATENTAGAEPNTYEREDGSEAYAQYEYKEKDYMLIESVNTVYVAEIVQDTTSATDGIVLDPLGPLDELIKGNNDETLIYAESLPFGTSRVIVTTAALSFMSLEEFAALLNEDECLKRLFKFTLTDEGVKQKDEYIEDLVDDTRKESSVMNTAFIFVDEDGDPHGHAFSLSEDKSITYDYSRYIPYKTSDNFARQLAQHCAYTTLRTQNTHGFIGLTPIRDLSLKSIANRAENIQAMDFDLYAKNYAGRALLHSDNSKYEVGRFISMTAFQYDITNTDGYAVKSNGASGYAGMVSNLDITQSSTNQPIDIPQGVDYTFSRSQLLNLNMKGVIAVSSSLTKGLVIVDGTTMATSTQYAQRLMVTRILDRCGEEIRRAAEPFIGKVNTIEHRNALKTAVDAALNQFVGSLIYSYSFNVLNLSTYTADAKIDINYTIFPINEIRNINNQITVTKSMA